MKRQTISAASLVALLTLTGCVTKVVEVPVSQPAPPPPTTTIPPATLPKQMDPDTIFYLIEKVFIEALGRGASQEDRITAYQQVRKWEAQEAEKLTSGNGGGTDFDLEASLYFFVQQQNQFEISFNMLLQHQKDIEEWFGE